MNQPTKRKPRIIRDDFDGAWKDMIKEKRIQSFMDLFHPDALMLIDWSRPAEFLEQELRAIIRKVKRGQRTVDKLVRVWLLDGTDLWILIHIEIQSQEAPDFAHRMFQCYYRADDLFEGRDMISIAVLGDDSLQWRPDRYQKSIYGKGVDFQFHAVKLMDYLDRLDELESRPNPFARFVLAHLKTIETRGDYESRLEWKLRIIKGLYETGYPEAEIEDLSHSLDWLFTLPEALDKSYYSEMVRFEEENEMPHYSTAERLGRKAGKKEGRKEGRDEGLVLGAQESILDFVEMRVGSVPAHVAEQMEQVNDLALLRKLRRLLGPDTPFTEFESALEAAYTTCIARPLQPTD